MEFQFTIPFPTEEGECYLEIVFPNDITLDDPAVVNYKYGGWNVFENANGGSTLVPDSTVFTNE
jgi:hypothetical protein